MENNLTHQTVRRRIALIEIYLTTNAFNILFILTYTISLTLMFLWGAHDEYMITQVPTKRWIIAIARGFGYTLNINAALVILLACRLIFTLLRETPLNIVIPLDKTFPNFHIIVGYIISVSVIGHAIFHMAWIIRWHAWASGLWKINMCVATGFIISLILLVMVVSSVPSVRKQNFALFYSLHNIGALFFVAILLVHGVYKAVPYTYKWLVAPLLLYAIDRLARKLKVSTSNVKVGGNNSVLKHDDIIKVRIPKQFNFRAGQYAEIKVPSINKYEWHPFTIASAPFEETMCFYIKSVGDWTTKLRLSLEQRLQGNNPIPMQVLLRGPFGAPAQHVRGYQRVVLISGGVGATPFASICKELFHHITKERNQDWHNDHYTPDSLPMIRAEMDLRSCLSDLYQNNINHFTDAEAGMGRTPISIQHLFTESSENDLFFSPITEAGEQPFSQRNYLDRLGLSFDKKRKASVAGLTPISVTREARYTLFEHPLTTGKMGTDSFETAGKVRADLFAPRAARVLAFFHSVMLNMLLCIAMLLRITFVAVASIFRSSMFSPSQVSLPAAREIAFASLDIGLGVLMIGVLLSSFIAELLVYRTAFFNKKARIGDVLLLLPLAFFSILYSLRMVLGASGASFMFYLPPWAHFFVILPLLIITLFHRLYRVIGAKVALADFASEPSLEKLRTVDFIWTMPFEQDDRWLREELEPVANGNELRLHRFLTRQEKAVSEEGGTQRGITTTFGRPDWESVFTKLAERTPSGGKVGVFFCGPKGMSKAIVSSIMKVQVLSNLRGTYLGTSSDKFLQSELELEGGDIRGLRARGCNIRFVFREENFN